MKRRPNACGALLVLACALLSFGPLLRAGAGAEPPYSVEAAEGKSLSLVSGRTTVWTLNHRKEEGKPYFHPVCLVDGTPLTWHRPPDHTWHRAIWFSWKLINGLNYWEENKEGLSQGRTDIARYRAEWSPEHGAIVHFQIDYGPPDKPAVLEEQRTIRVSLPDPDGCYRMDWALQFTAQDKDVVLDRTKTQAEGGPSWGGYAGLSYRAAQAMAAYQVLDSEGRRNMACHGKRARWADFSGLVGPEKRPAGVAIFDHPDNPRHPTPFYVIMSGTFGYLSPAFLFEEPCRLPAGKSLSLRYRMLIHPGRPEAKRLEQEYQDFVSPKGLEAK